jgi:large subunit ribosomal protein L29
MKPADIKELTRKEVIEQIQACKLELLKMRMNHAVSPIENPNLIRATRKDIARLKTELKYRELNNIDK